jgi:hypothetical protein
MAAPRKIGKNANVFDLLGDLDDAKEMAIEPVDPRSRSAQVAAAARSLKEPIIWIDCEMTGLDAQRDTILEIACVITDGKLNTTLEGPNIVIHHSDEVLAAMNAWCIDHHGKSGLTQRSRESSVSIHEAEERVLAFLTQHTKEQWAPLAGNSVHCDRQFLEVLTRSRTVSDCRLSSTIFSVSFTVRVSSFSFNRRACHESRHTCTFETLTFRR